MEIVILIGLLLVVGLILYVIESIADGVILAMFGVIGHFYRRLPGVLQIFLGVVASLAIVVVFVKAFGLWILVLIAAAGAAAVFWYFRSFPEDISETKRRENPILETLFPRKDDSPVDGGSGSQAPPATADNPEGMV
ncbi:hypothetical protein HH308_28080 [Gordonia sp. TBRC 11910]|uniref:Uncharacterized protein n=1 Tax=Gordonia asplenii TaxID=2725283 RepID=A0A848L2U6_9ACTN|nr:hypothetical protein [Gordonia asplenii]NMO05086.1 hypothetical protein [Gordonia asplenii]